MAANEQQHIKYAALAMIAGMPKLDRNFYNRDIEAIITEAKLHGEVLYANGAPENVRLTLEQIDAVRTAFETQNFRDVDALWLEYYDTERAGGRMPDAGSTDEAWWD